jgi:hypothetical protein
MVLGTRSLGVEHGDVLHCPGTGAASVSRIRVGTTQVNCILHFPKTRACSVHISECNVANSDGGYGSDFNSVPESLNVHILDGIIARVHIDCGVTRSEDAR